MHLYTEHTQPTVVTQSATLGRNGELAALVRGNSLLQVYEEGSRWIGDFPVEGTILHLETLHDPETGNERLVLAVRSAKIIILEWDYELVQLKTLSLHYYEKDIDGPFTSSTFPTKLTVDSRCIAFMFQKDKLAILPTVNTTGDLHEQVLELDSRQQELSPSFVVTSRQLDSSCTNVVDIAFLDGYDEPTLAVLHQTKRMWTGLDPVQPDDKDADDQKNENDSEGHATQLLCFGVNLSKQKAARVAALPNLTFDFTRIYPLSKPTGGCLVVGQRECLFVDSSGQTLVPTTPELGGINENMQLTELAHEYPQHQNVILVAASNKQLYYLRTHVEGNRTLSISFEPAKVAGVLGPSCMSSSSSGEVYIGSHKSDALVYHASIASDGDNHSIEFDKPESVADIYSQMNGAQAAQYEPVAIKLSLVARLPSLGPLVSVCNTPNLDLACAVAGVGDGEDAAAVFFQKYLDLRTKRTIPKLVQPETVTGMWTVAGYLAVSNPKGTVFYKGPTFTGRHAPSADVDTRQPTLALAVDQKSIVHVQPKSISIYSVRGWRLTGSIQFENDAEYAEVNGGHIVVLFADTTKAYKLPLAEVGLDEGINGNLASVGSSKVISSIEGGQVAIQALERGKMVRRYNFDGLQRIVAPLQDAPSSVTFALEAIYITKLGPTESPTEYIGILGSESFVLYRDLPDGRLLKSYSVQLPVRIEPECLVFDGQHAIVIRGVRSYIIVKDPRGPIQQIELRTSGDRIVDIVAYENLILYTDGAGTLYIAEPDFEGIDYTTTSLPFRKVGLGSRIRGLSWYAKSELVIVGLENKLQLLSTQDGCNVVFTMDLPSEEEHLLSLECMNLETGRDIVVIGTSEGAEEDAETNGYVRAYHVTGSVKDSGVKLKEISHHHLRGPVSGLAESMGRLVVSHGAQIHIFMLKPTHELEPIAFYDAQIYAQDLKSVRNLLGIGDAVCGTTLVNYCLEPQRLETLSRDVHGPTSVDSKVVCLEFVSSGSRGDLFLVVTDEIGRIRFLQFDPETPQSKGGTVLLNRASFYTGRQVTTMIAIECKSDSPPTFDFNVVDEDLVAIGGTEDGVLFSVVPLEESVYRILYVLTQQMMDKEQPLGCLNPRLHRGFLSETPPGPIIDYNYVENFWMLPQDAQEAYSRKLGQWGLEETRKVLESIHAKALR